MPDDFVKEVKESWRGSRSSNGSGNNSGVTINNLGKTSIILLASFAGFALAVAAFALIDGMRTERETRMLEYYVMENDHKLVQHGLLKPDETWSAQKAKREAAAK